MQQNDVPPEIIKALPGTLGAIVALRWIVGSPAQRVASVLGGASASYYGAHHVSGMLGTDDGFAGFLVGLFGMAVASKCFEAIQVMNIPGALEKFLRKWGF
jgi:hypothetical protein